MKFNQSRHSKIATVLGVIALTATTLFFQNCSNAPEIGTSSANVGSSGQVDATKLALLPVEVLIPAGTKQVFKITGGTLPYTWGVEPVGCGSFDTSTKTYTAPAGSTVCTFTITDGTKKQVRSIISVAENTLTASYSPNPAAASSNVEITPTGGTPGYTYSLVSGAGSLTGYIYRATADAETAVVKITDAQGKSVNLSIAIAGGGSGPSTGGSGTQKIFRGVNFRTGDVLTTKSQGEGGGFGYVDQPSGAITVFSTGGSSRKEIFRCFAFNHTISLNSSCDGLSNEGSLGFVEKTSVSGASRSVFACSNGASRFLTTTQNECAGAALIGFAP